MTTQLPEGLGAPAGRALAAAGITSLEDVAAWREADLADLHGVGPRAVAALRAALARGGADFRRQVATDADVVAIDAWFEGLDEPHATSLAALRATLRKVLPHADEGWSYGAPAVQLHGQPVAGYLAAQDHCSYLPHSGNVLAELGEHLVGHDVGDGVLRFAPGTKLPIGLVRRLVAARLAELAEVTDGMRREHHRDGRVRAEGLMRAGELHGSWAWYRADGTLLRTGTFRDGEQVGEWTTWNRDGTPV